MPPSPAQNGTPELLVLYNWLIWRVLKLACVFFKKVFSLYLFWHLEQSEQRHLCVDIFLYVIFNFALTGIRQKMPN